MTGIGLVIAFIGYCIVYWGITAITQDHDQSPFMDYVFPWRNQ